MRMGWATLAVLLLLTLIAAGCVGGSAKNYAGPTDVPIDAESSTGRGDFPVRVRVVQETGDGPPVVGAPVVIYPIEKPASAPAVVQLIRRNATLGGRTDAEGYLTARLDRGATYTFITAPMNWTTEARHIVKITDDLRDKALLMTVFATSKTAEVQGTVPTTPRGGPPLISFGGTLAPPPIWFPVEVKFHDDPHANRQYVYRLMTANSLLRWTVNPGEYAEFGLRVGFLTESDPNPRVYWEINRAAPLPPTGTFEETLPLEAPALAHGDAIKNPRFAAGPFTTQSVLAPVGLKWQVRVDATFSTDPVLLGPKPPMPAYALPSPALSMILLGLLGAALVWSRRP